MPLSTLRRQRLAESPYHPQESSKNKRAKLVSELPQSDKEKVNNAIDLALETLKEIGNFKYPLNGHHVDRCLSFLCETLHVLAKLWSDENSREFVEEATLERRIPYAVFKKAQSFLADTIQTASYEETYKEESPKKKRLVSDEHVAKIKTTVPFLEMWLVETSIVEGEMYFLPLFNDWKKNKAEFETFLELFERVHPL